MPAATLLVTILTAATTVLTSGCESQDERLARQAAESMQQQADQNRQMAELHQEVAQGARKLVESNAEARSEFVAMQGEVQKQQAEIGRQRDQLEEDRRTWAAYRRSDPMIASAITTTGLVIACVLPLVVCWYLLARQPSGEDDALVSEVLIQDIVSHEPVFLPSPGEQQLLGHSTASTPAPSRRDSSEA
jgi:hypothetical protein